MYLNGKRELITVTEVSIHENELRILLTLLVLSKPLRFYWYFASGFHHRHFMIV